MNEAESNKNPASLITGEKRDISSETMFLGTSEACLFIVEGSIDLFLTTPLSPGVPGAKTYFTSINSGGLITGLDLDGTLRQMCLVAHPNTRVLEFDRAQLIQRMGEYPETIGVAINEWLSRLASVPTKLESGPDIADLVSGEKSQRFDADQRLRNNQNHDLVLLLESGEVSYLGVENFKESHEIVICPGGLLRCEQVSRIKVSRLGECIRQDLSAGRLTQLLQSVAVGIVMSDKTVLETESARLEDQQTQHQNILGSGLNLMAEIFNKGKQPIYSNLEPALVTACRVACDKEGIPFDTPTGKEDGSPLTYREIEHRSCFRSREVILREKWWEEDHGTMVAFTEEASRPIALIPDGPIRYKAYDPIEQMYISVTAEYALTINPQAFYLYRPFEDKKLTLMELVKFGMRNSKRDVWVTLGISLIAALVGLVSPIAMSTLVDTVIPEANRNMLFFITIGLIAVAFANASFEITRGFAMQRFQGKNEMAIQSAVWDRLLALPVPFFQQYNAGELANRANGITAIMAILSGTTSTAVIGGVFSIFYFILMFVYNSQLAWIAAGLALLTILVTVLVNYIRLGYLRTEVKFSNELQGLVLQLLTGVAKLRNTGAEARGFYQWSAIFAKQRPQIFKAENISNYLETYNSVLPIISSMLFFWGVVYFGAKSDGPGISTGQFIAFNVAYGSFLGGMLGLTGAAMSIMQIIPIIENAKPVLDAIPERNMEKQQAPSLSGKIAVNNVRFRYDEDGPLVLDDISLNIEKGEYIALVGGSGSGKSTLLRVLLGFEYPETGTVAFDDIELGSLDIASLRRQLGVVLQNGTMLLGDLYKNIVGSQPLSVDDAWEAARMCGLAQDIEDMPMGMHTMVSAGVMSGGQMQRLMIARAIVHKPNILFFDEATSALDNRTQSIVTQSLDSLSVTRIVIAHRLSTIVNADRILFLDKGKIVEDGTYDELIEKDGYFAEMAKRQTL